MRIVYEFYFYCSLFKSLKVQRSYLYTNILNRCLCALGLILQNLQIVLFHLERCCTHAESLLRPSLARPTQKEDTVLPNSTLCSRVQFANWVPFRLGSVRVSRSNGPAWSNVALPHTKVLLSHDACLRHQKTIFRGTRKLSFHSCEMWQRFKASVPYWIYCVKLQIHS